MSHPHENGDIPIEGIPSAQRINISLKGTAVLLKSKSSRKKWKVKQIRNILLKDTDKQCSTKRIPNLH